MGKEFNEICRKVGSEGIVLLKNDKQVLPLEKGTHVSLFGRIQSNYIRGGTGSGGLVNVEYVVSIPEGLKKAGLNLNEELIQVYADWEKENPFDKGRGWATEPWAQVEMPVTDEIVKNASEKSDVAIVIIGRTAGEDKDNSNVEGSYLLTDVEKDMLAKVTKHFEKVIVVLNVGNIIDMSWVEEYHPQAVMYVWQGGQEGGNSIADVIVGNGSPSGRLTDTIAHHISDYPSSANFGNKDKNYYCEDIYVGYRYFCSFAKDKVQYPFGYGLSYTRFAYENCSIEWKKDSVSIKLDVKNIGDHAGKEVVQVYVQTPQGKLGKPERVLATYAKTLLLKPGEVETVEMEFALKEIASFDDTGVTGHERCFLLEKGVYNVLINTDCMTDVYRESFELSEDIILEQCMKAMYPIQNFNRMKPMLQDGNWEITYEEVLGEENNLRTKIDENVPEEIPYTGDKGIRLVDVRDGKAGMEEFIGQFSDEDLAIISFGEGMNSPKVTAGTGCAFGGLSESLLMKGVPIACGDDGPSGLRIDSGVIGTLMPNGTLMACTWNDALLEELFTHEGYEMTENNIDALLGPGINIHRHPLCGRNFEYFSEDPLLTGRIGYAICKGMANTGSTGVIKHFCGNNQETNRHNLDSVISERALREIYLRPFEIVVKMGDACKSIMTSYNPVNGTWTAGNYDLTTTILRDEWGYTGFVMSDWFARTKLEEFERNHGKIDQSARDYVPCVEAQNDIYMCCYKIDNYKTLNVYDSLKSGRLERAFAQRNAMNICNYLMYSNAMTRFLEMSTEDINAILGKFEKGNLLFESTEISLDDAVVFDCKKDGYYVLGLDILCEGTHLSQNTAIVYANEEYITSYTVAGSNGKVSRNEKRIALKKGPNRIMVENVARAISVEKISIFEVE